MAAAAGHLYRGVGTMLFAHHTKSYLGIGIEINDRPFPDGMIDHLLFFMAAALIAYGMFAIVRDSLRWCRQRYTAKLIRSQSG
jgi:hypothetical protein